MKKIYKISGMHCDSCATMIELDLEDAGIKNCKCSYKDETLEIEGKHNLIQITEIINKAGYVLEIN